MGKCIYDYVLTSHHFLGSVSPAHTAVETVPQLVPDIVQDVGGTVRDSFTDNSSIYEMMEQQLPNKPD